MVACPKGWKLIGKYCYKAFYPHHYTNWHIAQYKCQCNNARLPIFSDKYEAKLVTRRLRKWYSKIFVGAKYGKWLDGTPVENAYNSPSYYKKCLAAYFSRYGMHLYYTSCFKPVRKILCQRGTSLMMLYGDLLFWYYYRFYFVNVLFIPCSYIC